MRDSLLLGLFLAGSGEKGQLGGELAAGAGSLRWGVALRPRAHLRCRPCGSAGKSSLDLQFSATGAFLQIAIGEPAQLGLVKSQGDRDGRISFSPVKFR